MKIIVIDDEIAALNTFVINMVDQTDSSFLMFRSDPLASIKYVIENKVDAAFVDINMPIVNGIELAEKLIEARSTIAIVIISGYAHNEEAIQERLGDNLVGFCHKPYDVDTLVNLINEVKARVKKDREIKITTFGEFDVFIDGIPVKFTGKKTKELLALLVDRKGGFVSIETAMLALWPDSKPENGKRLYRDAVYKLRKDLSKVVLDIVEYGWGELRLINLDNIKCDYWEHLEHKTPNFCGSYLSSYEWSIERQLILENLYKTP